MVKTQIIWNLKSKSAQLHSESRSWATLRCQGKSGREELPPVKGFRDLTVTVSQMGTQTHPCFLWKVIVKSFLKTTILSHTHTNYKVSMGWTRHPGHGLSLAVSSFQFEYSRPGLKTLAGFVAIGFRPMEPWLPFKVGFPHILPLIPSLHKSLSQQSIPEHAQKTTLKKQRTQDTGKNILTFTS